MIQLNLCSKNSLTKNTLICHITFFSLTECNVSGYKLNGKSMKFNLKFKKIHPKVKINLAGWAQLTEIPSRPRIYKNK